MFMVVIDHAKCKGSEECVDICPNDALKMEEGKAVVTDQDACEGCMSCQESCPNEAIQVNEV